MLQVSHTFVTNATLNHFNWIWNMAYSSAWYISVKIVLVFSIFVQMPPNQFMQVVVCSHWTLKPKWLKHARMHACAGCRASDSGVPHAIPDHSGKAVQLRLGAWHGMVRHWLEGLLITRDDGTIRPLKSYAWGALIFIDPFGFGDASSADVETRTYFSPRWLNLLCLVSNR